MRPKHVPLRTCVACRTKAPKRDFVRVVLAPDGEIYVDPPRNLHGRGSYLCRSTRCWTEGIERGKLARALRVPGGPGKGHGVDRDGAR